MKRVNFSFLLPVLFYYLLFGLIQILSTAAAFLFLLAKGQGLADGFQLDNTVYEFMSVHAVEILLLSTLTTLAVLYVISLKKKEKFLTYIYMGNRLPFSMCINCFLMGLGANFWVSYIVDNIGIKEQYMSEYSQAIAPISGSMTLIGLITIGVLVPFLEEIVFRGVIFKIISSNTNALFAVLLQAILFSSLHEGYVWVVYALFLGFVIGYIRMCTGSLMSGIAFHIAFNVGSYILSIITYMANGNKNIIMSTFLVGLFVMLYEVQIIAKYNVKEQN